MDEEESRKIKTIPISNRKVYKTKTDPRFEIDQELYRSNSANDLLDLKEDQKKPKTQASKKKKTSPLQRTTSARGMFDHYNEKNCEHCPGINNMLNEDKSKLSSFIENNPQFLKLFGNPRYNKSSPFLFVEDHKNRIDDNRIGLLPIPSKPKLIMKTKDENNNLYEMQRKIVMMRRYQYGKNFNDQNLNNDDSADFFDKITKIQLWWKYIYKIIMIQKVFRGFRIRKRVNFILNFIDIINRWQRLLDNIKARRILRDLLKNAKSIVKIRKLPLKKNIKGYNYMSKIRRKGKSYLSLNNLDNLKKTNNNYQKFINNGNDKNDKNKEPQPNNKYNNYKSGKNKEKDPTKNNKNKDKNDEDQKNDDNDDLNKYINKNDKLMKNLNDLKKYQNDTPKEKIKNYISLITKEYFDKKDAMDKIDTIENNVKDFLRYKNNIQKKK